MSKSSNIYFLEEQRGKNIPEEKLLAYLEGRLSPEEQYEIEQLLAEGGPESDAIDGLRQMDNHEINHAVSNINKKLRKDARSNRMKKRNGGSETYWGWIAIIIVLLLAALGYLVVYLAEK